MDIVTIILIALLFATSTLSLTLYLRTLALKKILEDERGWHVFYKNERNKYKELYQDASKPNF